jgi:RNA polymerase sigma-70 factor (ECF subfamily)
MADAAPTRWAEDHALARRCVAGDGVAQRALYEREKRRVHAVLFRIFGSNAGIDDVIQEVFIQVFRSLVGFRGESSLATWIDRCTVRVAYAQLSKVRRRRAELELVQDIDSGDPTAERRALAREATRRLYAVLDDLDPKLRLAFVLQELEGNSVAEVAAKMEATVVATKTRVFRARAKLATAARGDPVLREFLEGDGEMVSEGEAS